MLAKDLSKSEPEIIFEIILQELGIIYTKEQYCLKGQGEGSKSRFDFVVPDKNIIFEVEGGIWPTRNILGKKSSGRHLTPTGFMRDCKKYNLATRAGWSLYRIPSPWLSNTKITSKNKKYMWSYEEVKDFVKSVVK